MGRQRWNFASFPFIHARSHKHARENWFPSARTHAHPLLLSLRVDLCKWPAGDLPLSLSLRRAAESGVDNTLARSLRPPPLRNSASITRVFCDTLYKPSPLLPWKASLNEYPWPPPPFLRLFRLMPRLTRRSFQFFPTGRGIFSLRFEIYPPLLYFLQILLLNFVRCFRSRWILEISLPTREYFRTDSKR